MSCKFNSFSSACIFDWNLTSTLCAQLFFVSPLLCSRKGICNVVVKVCSVIHLILSSKIDLFLTSTVVNFAAFIWICEMMCSVSLKQYFDILGKLLICILFERKGQVTVCIYTYTLRYANQQPPACIFAKLIWKWQTSSHLTVTILTKLPQCETHRGSQAGNKRQALTSWNPKSKNPQSKTLNNKMAGDINWQPKGRQRRQNNKGKTNTDDKP